MAQAKGARLGAIERIGALFASQHKLTPPVPIEEILRQRAVIEYAHDLPCEGVVLRRDGTAKVIIRGGTHPHRKRFTCGHELGHLIIPWHPDDNYCSSEDDTYSWQKESRLKTFEREADAFSANVLVPRTWLRSASTGKLADDIAAVQDHAQISVDAAARAVVDCLPGAAVLWFLDSRGGKPRPNYQSRQVYISISWDFKQFKDSLGRYAKRIVEFEVRGRRLAVAEFPYCSPELYRTNSDAKWLLAEALMIVKKPDLIHRINGIVSSANVACADRALESLYQALWQRFAQQDWASALILETRFCEFLYAKSVALAARKRRA